MDESDQWDAMNDGPYNAGQFGIVQTKKAPNEVPHFHNILYSNVCYQLACKDKVQPHSERSAEQQA